jgi:ribulose-5-phosphate 4-epimerase/fuculose-1-phosphate aldolase
MHDEKGYIQFQCEWRDAPPPVVPSELIAWRNRLHALGFIGVYPDGIGFGNISIREPFLISGTATGHLAELTAEHFSEVISFDIAANTLTCRGRVKASSESLSHAAVYRADPEVRAVIHVHHLAAWESLRGRVPTTDPVAEAGTPQMADAIAELFPLPGGFFVMGGHREGLVACGSTLDEAGERLLNAIHSSKSM